MTSAGDDLRGLRWNGNWSLVDPSNEPAFVVSKGNREWYVHTALIVIHHIFHRVVFQQVAEWTTILLEPRSSPGLFC